MPSWEYLIFDTTKRHCITGMCISALPPSGVALGIILYEGVPPGSPYPDLISCLFTHPFLMTWALKSTPVFTPGQLKVVIDEGEEWGKAVRRAKQKERQIRLNEARSLSVSFMTKSTKRMCLLFEWGVRVASNLAMDMSYLEFIRWALSMTKNCPCAYMSIFMNKNNDRLIYSYNFRPLRTLRDHQYSLWAKD